MNIIDSNLSFSSLTYNNNPQKIVLHHAEASSCSIYDIQSWHKANGWSGVGYHYFVRKDGSIYRGRPENAQGAHCPGANTCSIGICAEGSYTSETMPQAQFNAIKALIQDIRNRRGNLPIYGHRELYSTDCPGANFPLNEFKNMSGYVGSVSSEPSKLDIARKYAGGDTLKIQQRLLELGYNLGSYGADGSFGQITFEAIKKFQSDHGLCADGIPGEKTRGVLFNTTTNSTSSSDVSGLQNAINAYFGVSISVDGDYGPITDSYVNKLVIRESPNFYKINKWIQTMLINRGYNLGSYGADGYFGRTTTEAVKRYQVDHGLCADGIVGPITIKSFIGR